MIRAHGGTPGKVRSLPGSELSGVSDRQLLERFTAQRDEAAFAGLVERHGRTVWAVCRRLLHREQDVEDAFQGAFLVLARRAASIRKAEAVGSWLYGVAYRIAMRAKRQAQECNLREKDAAEVKEESPAWAEAACRELQRLLDEEIQRLPGKLRQPFVLCYLEGMSRAEAARELSWKEGTVGGRLAEARALLQRRLARRGVTLSAALAAGTLATTAAAPASVVQAAVTAGLAPAGSPSPASPAAVALARRHMRALQSARVKTVLVLALLLGPLLTVSALTAWQLGAGLTQQQAPIFDADIFVPPPVALGTAIDERVFAVAFTPDGSKLITAGGDPIGQIQIWDAASLKNLTTLRGISGVQSLAMALDRPVFATGDRRGQIKLRDAATGEEQASVDGHSNGVACVAFSRNGQLLISVGRDHAVRLWDGHDLKKRKAFLGPLPTSSLAAFFAKGRAVAIGSRDLGALLWDVETGQAIRTMGVHRALAVAVSPDDKLVATGSSDGRVMLWNAETGAVALTLPTDARAAHSVAFSGDGTLVAAGLADGTVGLWSVKSGKRLATLVKHDAEAFAVAFSPDGRRLASGSADKTAKICSLPPNDNAATLHTLSPQIRPIQAAAYSPDATVLAVATTAAEVQIRDAKSGDVLRLLVGHQGEVNCLAFSSDGKTLATGGTDRTVRLWDWTSGEPRRTLVGHVGAVFALAFTADGQQLASAGEDRVIRLWDVRKGEGLEGFAGHTAAVRALAFSPDQHQLASGGDDRVIEIWNHDRAKDPITLPGHSGPVRALVFCGDVILASAGDDPLVRLWDVRVQKEKLVLKGQANGFLALALTPTGRRVVGAGQNKTIHVWDRYSGNRLLTVLKGHKDAITALAMHPLGHDLVSGSHDTMLLRWLAAKEGDNVGAKPFPPLPNEKVAPLPPLPGGAAAPFRLTPAPAGTHGPRTWLLASLLVIVVLSILPAVMWLVARKRRRYGEAAPNASIETQVRLSVICPGCGKAMWVLGELAGNKVKCPQCGQAVLTPETHTCPTCGHGVVVKPAAPKKTPRPRPRRKRPLLIASIAVLLVVGVAVAFWMRSPRRVYHLDALLD
jgi:RNA polymerase sigma factor (sigma-70 family)